MFLTAAPILLLASTSSSVNGFGPLHPSRHPSGRFQISRFTKSIEHTSVLLNAKNKNDDANSKGMEDAFKQLEDLKSLGDDVFSDLDRKAQDEAFAKAMKELDLKGLDEIEPPTPEAEAALFSDMASELAGASEIDLIDNVKAQLGGKKTEIPKFDPNSRETEKFLEKALDEAIEEASSKTSIDKESLLDNKEIMKEIEAIFERANDQLLEGLEDIRKEQIELAQSSSVRNSKATEEKFREEEERLAAAESNMKKMLEKVSAETKNVEKAIEDLKAAQKEMDGGVDSQLLDLKKGGIVKQATLVGTLLFSLRAVTDGIAFIAGDSSHLMPALIQAGIALVCFAIFAFTK